ncbi:hypothetical protein AJ80_05874 [Polytolypa hystricis UAMH7299]|uniref:CBM20 domain-containing protein n=1 Tax=Polytolypa hystricis (strain UAMH7299) TaxID=1447883 RepID=A0A2B7XS07_POLH7|nr:hypothetical protein AJ80_05874 [Polytolypa hystricis UAMH7299]
MAAVQLNFTLRTSTNVKTVHLLGSWDGYKGQLPLSKDSSAKPGSWKGTFRFQNSTLKLGQRYWYYYILDGYHVSHDPAVRYDVEPTTSRKLNILDVPGNPSSTRTSTSSHARTSSQNVVQGRALSPSKIMHPKPSKPYASRQLREADFSMPSTVEELTARYSKHELSDSDSDLSSSPPSSAGSSLSSRSSPSSLSSLSDDSSLCSCERYGITRRGDRVKIDCGGSRCGGKSPLDSDSDSSYCCDSDSEEEYRHARPVARGQRISVRR